jgi:hypothetical protein
MRARAWSIGAGALERSGLRRIAGRSMPYGAESICF